MEPLEGEVTLRRRLSPLGVQLEALGVAAAEERPALVLVEHALAELAHEHREVLG